MGASRRIMVFTLTAILILGAALAAGSMGAGAGPGIGDVESDGLRFVTERIVAKEDATVHSWFPFTNYGSNETLVVRAGDVAAALLRFDLSQVLSPDALLAQATLKLYVLSPQSRFDLSVVAYGVNRLWVEREATWQRATTGTNWSVVGCNGIPADRAATGSDPVTISEPGKWVALDVTSIVQAWFDGTALNNGLIVKGQPGDSVEYRFASANHYDPALRPVLQIVYAIPPTPTPMPMEPWLKLEKTGPVGPISDPSVTIHYDISVQNIGRDVAHNVVISDELPLGVVYVSSTEDGVYSPTEHTITWSVATLEISETISMGINVNLASWIKAGGIVANVAHADCPNCYGGGVTDVWSLLVGPPPSPTPTLTPMVRIQYLPQIYKGYRQR